MTPTAAAALLAMSTCVGSEMAEHYARLALERGATHDEIAEAWRLWRAEQTAEVQVIHADPRPDTLCACSDIAFWHEANTGRCIRAGCGCRTMRPGGRRWVE